MGIVIFLNDVGGLSPLQVASISRQMAKQECISLLSAFNAQSEGLHLERISHINPFLPLCTWVFVTTEIKLEHCSNWDGAISRCGFI